MKGEIIKIGNIQINPCLLNAGTKEDGSKFHGIAVATGWFTDWEIEGDGGLVDSPAGTTWMGYTQKELVEIYIKEKGDEALEAEYAKINEAKAYMRKWQDMSMSYLQDDLCKLLHIKPSAAAYELCFSLLVSPAQKIAIELFLIR